MLDDSIGYIILANFDGDSSISFISAADELIMEGARAFIFDFRSNGGGWVSEMTSMLDYLLPEGEIFVAIDKEGYEEIIYSEAEMVDIPCVVLVDRYSFSAAEYFAATLREYGYAIIVGEQTSGKSRSQMTYPLPGGGALHISTGQYLTKNRISLFDAGGLTPDHEVLLNEDEFNLLLSGELPLDADPQLITAIGILSNY
jgi:carboxyl-terminal processing protease